MNGDLKSPLRLLKLKTWMLCCVCLALAGLPGAGRASSGAPIVTSLDAATLPARGGECTVLWMGAPEITPEAAELTFYLTQPDGTGTSARQAIALAANKVGQRTWSFATPAAGVYKVSALARLKVAGGEYVKENSLSLAVPQTGAATLVKAAAPTASADLVGRASKSVAQAPRAASTAAFYVSGTYKFTNKLYTTAGFTGTRADPVRVARVEVWEYDNGTPVSLGSTKTDNSGYFELQVANNIDGDGTGRDIAVRIWTDSDVAAVISPSSGNTWGSTSAIQQDWAGGNLNLGTITFDEANSGAFNIHEAMLRAYTLAWGYIAGGIPKLTCKWAPGSTAPTVYHVDTKTLDISGSADDPDEYDDDVLYSMYAHHLNHTLSYVKDPGGAHSWASHTTPAKAWAEGWAGFYSRAVKNTTSDSANARYWVDTTAHGVSWTDAELPTGGVTGEDCEGAVTAFLWDMYDTTSDGADTVNALFGWIWRVYTTYFNSQRGCTVRDFIDGYLAENYNYAAEMRSLLWSRGIYYGTSTATVGGSSTSLSIASAGEVDWVYFTVTTPAYYQIDTVAGTLTNNVMWLYGPNSSTTLIVQDDDSGAGNMARILRYLTAGTYYIKVAAYSSTATGSYTLNVRSGPSVSGFSINAGAASTSSRAVTLNLSCTGSPTQYMASESSSFSGAAWLTYSAAPGFTITSAGTGVKTIYVKVKDAAGLASAAKSDTITLNDTAPLAVNSFAINNGASLTNSRTVTLNNICSGAPAQLMASESSSFTGAAWVAYSAAPSFTFTTSGSGPKTVYLKVKNAAGLVSNVLSDSILFSDPLTALRINGSPLTGSLGGGGDEDWYSFAVTTSGTYIIQTIGGTLPDTYIRLYGPNSKTTLIAEDDNSGQAYSGELIRTLAPGTYYVKVTPALAQNVGNYTITILRDPLILALSINGGAISTASRTVKINNACSGKPVYYMASESSSFTGAAWAAYGTAPSFTISSVGSGPKVIYFKVKDAAGVESQALSRIVYLE